MTPKKSLLFRLFGLGKIPKSQRSRLENEGIVLVDEGVPASIKYRNYRAPGKYFKYKTSWFSAAVVWTRESFTVIALGKTVLHVPIKDKRLGQLELWVKQEHLLKIKVDVSHFSETSSGTIECTLKTGIAGEMLTAFRRAKADK
jgi:hypothetical protein